MIKTKGSLQDLIDFVSINEKAFEAVSQFSKEAEENAYIHYKETYSFYPELERRSKRVSNLIAELNKAQLDLCAYIKTFKPK